MAVSVSMAGTAETEASGFQESRRIPDGALVLPVVALVASAPGFGGIAGIAAAIARILFIVFLVLFTVGRIMHPARGCEIRRPVDRPTRERAGNPEHDQHILWRLQR